jgi:hypothetical protein
MTILGCERLFSAELVCDFSAVTTAFPLDGEVVRLIMNTVWFSSLPLIFLFVCGIPRLELMRSFFVRHVR